MPHNPISVGMRVYTLELKQKSTAAGFDGILRKFRSAFLKRKQKRRSTRSDPCGSRFSLFPGHLFIKSWNNRLSRQIFAQRSLPFWIMLLVLSSPVFTIKILMAKIFGCYQTDNYKTAWRSSTSKMSVLQCHQSIM